MYTYIYVYYVYMYMCIVVCYFWAILFQFWLLLWYGGLSLRATWLSDSLGGEDGWRKGSLSAFRSALGFPSFCLCDVGAWEILGLRLPSGLEALAASESDQMSMYHSHPLTHAITP